MSLSSSSAGVLAEAVTAPGSRLLLLPQPVHGHSLLSDSQISPIRSLTAALALSQSPSQSPSQAGLASAVAAAQSFRPPPLVDASGAQQQQQQELLVLKVDDIQRLCESLVQVQAQQAQKIRSLEATVRRLSDVSSPPSSHHQQQQHQRETMPSLASAAAAVASSGGSRRLSHLPPIQASMALPPNMAQHRAADYMAEEGSAQWLDPLRPPQPTVAYQQSHGQQRK
ncbi:hypothetical protein GGF42_008444 [Coemansia sp. RSA 2424]|nr:hypothetical protein GGF42_008444 [Coemansia sp. RSA 2424]